MQNTSSVQVNCSGEINYHSLNTSLIVMNQSMRKFKGQNKPLNKSPTMAIALSDMCAKMTLW